MFGSQTRSETVVEDVRKATHAGTWYSKSKPVLEKQISGLLKDAITTDAEIVDGFKGVIAPHAGLSYSGRTAGHSFQYLQKHLESNQVDRIFVLGPSHHLYIDGCGLTKCSALETPLGKLEIDVDIIKELYSTGKFKYLTKDQDEDEHSIEMQLPFLKYCVGLSGKNIKIVPVIVGSINPVKEEIYGKIFASYLKSNENIFVISSDFCHWGSRFDYTRTKECLKEDPIWKGIEKLDQKGIKAIETLNPIEFNNYLKSTKNTICGRHPISVILNSINIIKNNDNPVNNNNDDDDDKSRKVKKQKNDHQNNNNKEKLHFIHYEQSSKVLNANDSSVSYASAYFSI